MALDLRRHGPALPLVPPVRAMHAPAAACMAVAIVTLAGAAAKPMLGYSLLPSVNERDFPIHGITDPNSFRPEMLRNLDRRRSG